jgi:gamma-glutamyltranspeptidase/glutathione hydrolase
MVARKWQAAVPILQEHPGFARAFMPDSRAPRTGELFRFPDAARTLRLLAEQGPRAFYEGEIAEATVRFAGQTGGSLTLRDLANYQPEWVEPVSQRYRGYDVHELPPNGQGIAALIALGILEQFDIAGMGLDSADAQHLQIEAMKLAFADVWRYVADPASMEVTPEQMLDPCLSPSLYLPLSSSFSTVPFSTRLLPRGVISAR